MPWNAIDALHDAREATQSFLLPVDLGRWARLALVALFVGGATGFPAGGNAGTSADVGELPAPGGEFPPIPGPDVGGDVFALIVGLVVLAVVLAILWSVAGAVMEFVLVQGLRSREMHVRRRFRRYLGSGLRLFAFRLVVGLITLATVGLPVAGVVFAGTTVSPGYFALFLPLVLLFLAVGVVVAVVFRFTTDFVVPTMILEGEGVRAGWRRLLPVFRTEWREFGLYAVVRFLLGIGVGIAAGLATGLVALVAALPFLVVGVVVYGTLVATGVGFGPIAWVLVAVAVAAYLLVVFAVGLFVQVPVVTFFRYYALFFLGAEEPGLDPVADLRTDATAE